MLTDTTIKRLNAISDVSKHGKRVNGLSRLMESQELWKQAYSNIKGNTGAVTKSSDNITLDSFSEKRIETLIDRIRSDTYYFTPVRRAYIPKKNGKMRPLGVPNGNDKLVQEVVRIILNQIYEPIFCEYSHGFRGGRSCHTALTQIKQTWTGAKWLIEMDIKGFFDNINHDVMIRILEKKIDDKRFIKLIAHMLKAGYIEDYNFNPSYSGTPQGGIISPILANIYLHEMDEYLLKLKTQFVCGKERHVNPEYDSYRVKIAALRKRYRTIKETAGSEEVAAITAEIDRLTIERMAYPYGDPFDPTYHRLLYSRYADDFIIGIIGSRKEAEEIAGKVERFIEDTLCLQVAIEKFKICHASEGVRYLGFDVVSYSGNRLRKVKSNGTYSLKRTTNERMQLVIPEDKLNAFAVSKGYGDYFNYKPESRGNLTQGSDVEIIETYNAELRGICNFYSIGNSAKRKLNQLVNLGRSSCAMTIAHKHKSTTRKVIHSMMQANGEWQLMVPGEKKDYIFRLYRLKTDFKIVNAKDKAVDVQPDVLRFTYSITEWVSKLDAHVCEYCGAKDVDVEIHHVKKLKNLKGKSSWEKIMIARRRKTIVLCARCHYLLHQGLLD